MKRFSLWFALLVAPVPHLFAQVTADIVLEQEQFLVGESLEVAVRIVNRSGQPLQFGDEADWLTFSVESRDKFTVIKNTEVPVEGAFVLETGKVATRRVDLEPYFTLTQIGRYQVTATVKIKEWDRHVVTKPRAFDIINAAKLWSEEVGVPSGVTDRPPEVRRYTLEQANYLRTQLRLYLRVTDGEGTRVIKVLPLGQVVSFSNPEHQLDREGNLHVFYQNGARSFSYYVVNPHGEILVRQTHDYAETRPRLRKGDDGKIIVSGGLRRETLADVPATNLTEASPAPATTNSQSAFSKLPPGFTNAPPVFTTPPPVLTNAAPHTP
jgi:hypothetical protein